MCRKTVRPAKLIGSAGDERSYHVVAERAPRVVALGECGERARVVAAGVENSLPQWAR